MLGEFLPVQLIYQGKTDRCHPSFPSPGLAHHAFTESLVDQVHNARLHQASGCAIHSKDQSALEKTRWRLSRQVTNSCTIFQDCNSYLSFLSAVDTIALLQGLCSKYPCIYDNLSHKTLSETPLLCSSRV